MKGGFIRLVDCELDEPLTLEGVAEAVGMRPALLARLVRLGLIDAIADGLAADASRPPIHSSAGRPNPQHQGRAEFALLDVLLLPAHVVAVSGGLFGASSGRRDGLRK